MEKLFLEICDKIKKQAKEDSGFKGGVYTTAYKYTVNGVMLNKWDGDAEKSLTLMYGDEKVGRWYQCWDHPVEFECNEKLLKIIVDKL